MKPLLIISFLVLLNSCERIDNNDIKKQTILEYFDVDTSWHFVANRFSSCLQDSIDSYLEIRFSTHGVFFHQPNKYLHLKYNGHNWKGVIGLRPQIVGDSSYESEITPKIGWKNFEDSLISIDINSLLFINKEQDTINPVVDGESLHLEIITSNQYKIYSYHSPESLLKKQNSSPSLIKFSRVLI